MCRRYEIITTIPSIVVGVTRKWKSAIGQGFLLVQPQGSALIGTHQPRLVCYTDVVS